MKKVILIFMILFLLTGCGSLLSRTSNVDPEAKVFKGWQTDLNLVKEELAKPHSGGSFLIPAFDAIPSAVVDIPLFVLWDWPVWWVDRSKK